MKDIFALLFSLLGVCAFVGIPAVILGFAFGVGFGLGYGVV